MFGQSGFRATVTALIVAVVACEASSVNLHSLFGPHISPGAEIFVPSDANWTTEVTQRWSSWLTPSYIGAIKPTTEADIQTIVRIAAKHEIPFLVTGGGHGTAIGYATIQNALNIDLSNFKSIQVDASNNRVTLGGAVTFGDVWEPLYEVGQEIPTGNAHCVGMLGVTMGGGVGTLQGLHGMVLDSLESVRLVTATGDLIDVSSTQNPDLFWAIRGAGANFGIVTEATYKTYNATNDGKVVNADYVFPASTNRTLWEFLQTFDDDNLLPPELSLTLSTFYNRTANAAFVLVNVVYFGPPEGAQPYLDRLDAIGPIATDYEYLTWPELGPSQFFASDVTMCEDDLFINMYGMGLAQTYIPTFESFFADLTSFYEAHESYEGTWTIQRYGIQNTMAVPESETAYPWRNIKMQLLFENLLPDSSLDSAVDAFMLDTREKFQATSGFPSLQVYINYDHGDEGPAAWWGQSNLPKLIELKQKWDPKGLFGKGNPVPTTL